MKKHQNVFDVFNLENSFYISNYDLQLQSARIE